MLNARGGIVSDLTVNRISEDTYMIVTSAGSVTRDYTWMRRHIPDDARATLTDVSSSYAVLSVMGPRSRDLLSRLTDADLSNEAFPFLTSKEIYLGYAPVRASRITYVGELGWELYILSEYASNVYESIVRGGRRIRVEASPATMRWTRCGWKRRTGAGATTSPVSILHLRPGLDLQ